MLQENSEINKKNYVESIYNLQIYCKIMLHRKIVDIFCTSTVIFPRIIDSFYIVFSSFIKNIF